MKKKSEGRTLTIFLVVLSVLFICFSAIALFLLQKEKERRRHTEVMLQDVRVTEGRLSGAMEEAKEKIFLLEEKNKDLAQKVEEYLDEIDLEKGLREEVRQKNEQLVKERDELKKALENESKNKTDFRDKMNREMETLKADLADEKTKNEALSSQNDALSNRIAALMAQLNLQQENEAAAPAEKIEPAVPETAEPAASGNQSQSDTAADMEKQAAAPMEQSEGGVDDASDSGPAPELTAASGVLPQGESGPNAAAEKPEAPSAPKTPVAETTPVEEEMISGQILSVDTDANFIIFNLGKNAGIQPGDMMSIYRGKEYLGDVKVSRVQEDMAAADFVPPFSSQLVRKFDRVTRPQHVMDIIQ